jgi:superfamily II DNA or RNA helicase
MQLRDYQTRTLHDLKVSVSSGKRRPLVYAPTGSGKTVLAAAIVEGARAKGNRVIFVVPALSLVEQTARAFYQVGLRDVGIVQGNHLQTDWSKPIQIASVQTLARRPVFLDEFKSRGRCVVVCDESHLVFDFYKTWFKDWSDTIFIGLSATPYSKGLGKLYDDLITAETTAGLIDRGYLSPFRCFAPTKPEGLDKVKITAGDYNEGQLGEAMNRAHLVGDAVSTWLKLGENRPTFVFAVTCAHAQNLCDSFKDAGVNAEYVDANTPSHDREMIFRRFQRGETRVIANVGILTTGIDLDVRCIVLCRPTKSKILYQQIIGRGLRVAPGKTDLKILDHSDTIQNLGFVTDIDIDKLDDGRPNSRAKDQERTKPLPKECPQCHYLKPSGVRKCAACGFETKAPVNVDVSDGELSEITGVKGSRKAKKAYEWTKEEREIFFGELKWVCHNRGYKEGWAANKYRDRFGVWPTGMKYVPDLEPSPATMSWLKSTQIRWAKSKKREEMRA